MVEEKVGLFQQESVLTYVEIFIMYLEREAYC